MDRYKVRFHSVTCSLTSTPAGPCRQQQQGWVTTLATATTSTISTAECKHKCKLTPQPNHKWETGRGNQDTTEPQHERQRSTMRWQHRSSLLVRRWRGLGIGEGACGLDIHGVGGDLQLSKYSRLARGYQGGAVLMPSYVVNIASHICIRVYLVDKDYKLHSHLPEYRKTWQKKWLCHVTWIIRTEVHRISQLLPEYIESCSLFWQ